MSPQSNSPTGETGRSIIDQGETMGQPSSAVDGAVYGALRDDAIWVTECAWCQLVRTPSGDWHPPSPGIHAGMGVVRTHGICPQCARAAVARADQIDDRSP